MSGECSARIFHKGGSDEILTTVAQSSSFPLEKFESISNLAWKMLPFHSLPEWLRDNDYIRGSYRPPMSSFRGCFKSVFRLHNETWNIWTHLVGFLFFVILLAGVYTFGDYITGFFSDVRIYELPWNEQIIMSLFFCGAIICLLCSTLFHILHNHSNKINFLFSRLDYSGIAFLITGSSIPAYYYGFYCTKFAQTMHISILVALCIICICISLMKEFNTPKYRMFRFVVFVVFGLYGAIPFIHIYLRDGYMMAAKAYALWGIISMAFLYIGGGFLYAFRIPERFWPGKFDVWASSHQIFHVCVLIAALVHYHTLLKMIRYRLTTRNCLGE